MAKCGFLNSVRHTGNGLEQLQTWGSENYTNPAGYVNAQAVSDRRIVTANGSATLEFARELLLLLENDTPERIEMYYQFNKQGFCALSITSKSIKNNETLHNMPYGSVGRRTYRLFDGRTSQPTLFDGIADRPGFLPARLALKSVGTVADGVLWIKYSVVRD